MGSLFLLPAVETKGGEGERKEKSKEDRSYLAKSVIHWKQGCENGQTDPLDGRIQVEDELRRERTVSSSDP